MKFEDLCEEALETIDLEELEELAPMLAVRGCARCEAQDEQRPGPILKPGASLPPWMRELVSPWFR